MAKMAKSQTFPVGVLIWMALSVCVSLASAGSDQGMHQSIIAAKDEKSGDDLGPSKTALAERLPPKFGNRITRQINPLSLMGNGGLAALLGTGSGTAITAANAAMGQSISNGNSFTDRWGNSRSMANGAASGYGASTTSIATSNSQSSTPYGMMGYGRRKRQAFGMPGFLTGLGSGTAITAANAAMGQSQSNGNSYADPLGNTVSMANGFSSGYAPSTTSIVTSGSQGALTGLPYMGRKKRDAETQESAITVRTKRQMLPMNGRMSGGSAVGTANAVQGITTSSGNTFSSGGFTNSFAQGQSMGYLPTASTVVSSNSGSNFLLGRRRRRDTVTLIAPSSPKETINHHSTIESGKELAVDQKPVKKLDWKAGEYGHPLDLTNAKSILLAEDREMVPDEHLDPQDGRASHEPVSGKPDARSDEYATFVPARLYVDPEPAASLRFDEGPVVPYVYTQTPIARSGAPEMFGNPFAAAASLWHPVNQQAFMASIQAANKAVKNSGGYGNAAGVVAVSGDKPDGATYAGKLVDYNTPVQYTCTGSACSTAPAVPTAPAPLNPAAEVQRDTREMATTQATTVVSTSAPTAASAVNGTSAVGPASSTVTPLLGTATSTINKTLGPIAPSRAGDVEI